MDYEASMEHLLACMLLDPSAEPTDLPMWLLKTITNNFSDHEKIGRGGFADVYKGELQNGTLIAVKKLFHNLDMEEQKFIKEVGCLMMAKHKNIVRFLGYCSDTQGRIMNHEGKMIQAEERHRLLCFEFLPKGSLDKHITDVAEGLEWRTRYKIIKEICEGLHYLHQDIHIVHSDLKPANILLDENMVPKIADFGLARCFDEKQSKTMTSIVMGTVGYMAPESYDRVITFKSDIYSLGIIIMEILTGRKGYCDIQNVRVITGRHMVATCARMCGDWKPVHYIIGRLDEMERTCGFTETDICASSETQVLDVYPLDIWFPPFEPDNGIKCPVTITNRTGDLIGVCIKPTFADARSSIGYPYAWECGRLRPYTISSPFIRLGPHYSVTMHMTMRKQKPPLLQADKGMFDVVMVAMNSLEDLQYLGQLWSRSWISITNSWRSIIKELGTVVHRATLRVAVTSDAARCQQDVVAVHQVRIIRFEVVTHLQEFKYCDREIILSIKFIPGEDWVAAGGNNGRVYVCAYTSPAGMDKVKEWEAHREHQVTGLAAYPKQTLLLTASKDDKSIKLWDWSQGWTCARVFVDADNSVYHYLRAGPRDSSIFACSNHNHIKVWDFIHALLDITTFQEPTLTFTFCTDGHRDFVASLSCGHTSSPISYGHASSPIKIWDWQTKKHVHSLYSQIWPWILDDLASDLGWHHDKP